MRLLKGLKSRSDFRKIARRIQRRVRIFRMHRVLEGRLQGLQCFSRPYGTGRVYPGLSRH
jgi:hypothetical protein